MTIGSAGVPAPGTWRLPRAPGWLATLCVVIVVAFNAVAKATLWLLVKAADSPLASTSTAPASYKPAAAIAGSIALVATYWVAVRFGERRKVPELDLRRAPSDLLLGLMIGTALMRRSSAPCGPSAGWSSSPGPLTGLPWRCAIPFARACSRNWCFGW